MCFVQIWGVIKGEQFKKGFGAGDGHIVPSFVADAISYDAVCWLASAGRLCQIPVGSPKQLHPAGAWLLQDDLSS